MNNWKKVFNDNSKKEYLKQLLKDMNKDDIQNSLQNIIDKWLENKSYCSLENSQDKYLYTLVSNQQNIIY